jgi:cystathionine beta-lyase/cystathionine gamma-synthase
VEFTAAFTEVCFRSVLSHASIPCEERVRMGITDNLVRISVGLEDPDDIIADLELAFRSAVSVL